MFGDESTLRHFRLPPRGKRDTLLFGFLRNVHWWNWTPSPLKMGQRGCSETSVTTSQCFVHIPEAEDLVTALLGSWQLGDHDCGESQSRCWLAVSRYSIFAKALTVLEKPVMYENNVLKCQFVPDRKHCRSVQKCLQYIT